MWLCVRVYVSSLALQRQRPGCALRGVCVGVHVGVCCLVGLLSHAACWHACDDDCCVSRNWIQRFGWVASTVGGCLDCGICCARGSYVLCPIICVCCVPTACVHLARLQLSPSATAAGATYNGFGLVLCSLLRCVCRCAFHSASWCVCRPLYVLMLTRGMRTHGAEDLRLRGRHLYSFIHDQAYAVSSKHFVDGAAAHDCRSWPRAAFAVEACCCCVRGCVGYTTTHSFTLSQSLLSAPQQQFSLVCVALHLYRVHILLGVQCSVCSVCPHA